MVTLLSPKMDFIFKKIFGNEQEKSVLLSFLNLALKPVDLITDVELRNVEINKESLENKNSRLDIKAVTNNGTIINVDVEIAEETVTEIKKAKGQLYRISADEDERELYRIREKAYLDEISALAEAESKGVQKGIEQGRQEEKLELARGLLGLLPNEIIANKTGLSLEIIEKLISNKI